MDEEKYQKELFEFEKPKRFFPKLSNFFPKADFERNVVFTLTLDRVVFIAIGILMIIVVVYALGVEAGKTKTPEVVQAATAPAVPQSAVREPVKVPVAIPAQVVTQKQPVRMPAPAKPYTILVATFTRKDNAVQEIEKLKNQGIAATLIQSGSYFQVNVGAYASKADAQGQKDLARIKRLYKDAYLKSR